jgi:lipoprotein-anchoring transpeptidase ErfK/SrfK
MVEVGLPSKTALVVAAILSLCGTGAQAIDEGRSYATWRSPSQVEGAIQRLDGEDELGREASSTRTLVEDPTGERPGTITIDTKNRYLYLSIEGGKAMRYDVGVGREGFTWTGRAYVGRRAEWPAWTPPPEMLQRRPDLPRTMAGGIHNPLGARAMYLYNNRRDTMFRIHGTNEPDTVGRAVSSGCIRLLNEDIVDLYARVKVGAPVIVL